MVRGVVDIWIAEHQDYPLRLVINEAHLGFENRDAGALAADQRRAIFTMPFSFGIS